MLKMHLIDYSFSKPWTAFEWCTLKLSRNNANLVPFNFVINPFTNSINLSLFIAFLKIWKCSKPPCSEIAAIRE